MWKNLLPQSTRSLELYSSIALIVSGLLIILHIIPVIPSLIFIDMVTSWGFIILVFGLLQFICIYDHPKLELLRTIMSWIIGCLWIWISVSGTAFIHTYDIEDIATFCLGLGNLYGFIINFNLLHIIWTE